MGRKEIVLNVKETAVIGFTCECGTQVLFDCSKADAVPPADCPSCGKSSDMNKMMWDFKRFYERVKGMSSIVEFHVPIPD
jgi:hypothetical protein